MLEGAETGTCQSFPSKTPDTHVPMGAQAYMWEADREIDAQWFPGSLSARHHAKVSCLNPELTTNSIGKTTSPSFFSNVGQEVFKRPHPAVVNLCRLLVSV